jgi:hypothetical protein
MFRSDGDTEQCCFKGTVFRSSVLVALMVPWKSEFEKLKVPWYHGCLLINNIIFLVERLEPQTMVAK